ncbi:MAG: helix-turn-helix domain-containing protein [Bryobacteraceae bacterium]|jgi:hypothetical protein
MATERSETMSLPDVCQHLGLSWPQGWRLVLTGALPARKIANRWTVQRRDLEHLARQRANRIGRHTGAAVPFDGTGGS